MEYNVVTSSQHFYGGVCIPGNSRILLTMDDQRGFIGETYHMLPSMFRNRRVKDFSWLV